MRNANHLKRGNPISFVFVKNVYITIKKQIHMIFCPFISTVKLLNSNTSLPRVEVLFGGFWGPICNSLGIQPANIVCRELGYEKAYAVVDSGQRNVEICLDTSSMRCMGNETSILQCQSIRFSDGPTAASVICSPAGIFFISCELSVFFNSKLSVLESSTGKEHGKWVLEVELDNTFLPNQSWSSFPEHGQR